MPFEQASLPTVELAAAPDGEGSHRSEARSGRGRRWLLAGAAAVIAVGGAAYVMSRVVSDGSGVGGGAADPEGAVHAFADAVSSDDLLAATLYVAPDELDGLASVAEQVADRLAERGITGARAGEGLDVDINVTELVPREEADDAVVFDVEFTATAATGGLTGPLGAYLPDGTATVTADDDRVALTLTAADGHAVDGDDDEVRSPAWAAQPMRIVVVQIEGRWFVSPMLTAADIIAEYADLSGGDYSRAGSPETVSADSPQAAVEALIEAVGERSTRDVADALGGGEGRVVRVFEEAIDDLLFYVPGDFSLSAEASATELADGWVRVNAVDATVGTSEFSASVEVSRTCVEIEHNDYYMGESRSGRVCLDDLLDLVPFRFDPLSDGIEMLTEKHGDGYQVRLLPTATRVAEKALELDWPSVAPYVFEMFGLEQFDAATPLTVGAPFSVTFDDQLYAVYEFDAVAGTRYRVDVRPEWLDNDEDLAGDAVAKVVWHREDGWETERLWSAESIQPAADGPVRVVVHSKPPTYDKCRRGLYSVCTPTGTGTVDVSVSTPARQPIDVGTSVSGELRPGEEVGFDVAIGAPTWLQVDRDTPAVTVTPGDRRASRVSNDESTLVYLETGVVYVANGGDVAQPFTLTFTTPTLPVAVPSRGASVGADVEAQVVGSMTVYVVGVPGSSVRMTVTPDASADVDLYADGTTRDQYDAGGAESATVIIGDDGYSYTEIGVPSAGPATVRVEVR